MVGEWPPHIVRWGRDRNGGGGGGYWLGKMRWRRGKEQLQKENEEGRFEKFLALKRRWHGELSWMMEEASL